MSKEPRPAVSLVVRIFIKEFALPEIHEAACASTCSELLFSQNKKNLGETKFAGSASLNKNNNWNLEFVRFVHLSFLTILCTISQHTITSVNFNYIT